VNIVKNTKNIEEILQRINNIPALPSIADEALRILNDKNSNKNDIVNIISKEQSFIAKILSVANSPIYGLRKEVSTLSFAVFVLGIKEIKKVVLALAFIESFKMVKDKFFNPQEFWLHSFVVGNLARKIAMDLNINNTGESFVGGFLHDFSVSVLHRDFNNEYVQVCNLVEESNLSCDEAENEVIGMTHADLSKIILSNWEFPKILIDAIANHHLPSSTKIDKKLTSIIHLADYVTWKFKLANYRWDKDYKFDETIIDTLQFLNRDSLDEFIEQYKEFINIQINSIRNLL
jgi:HD-like signal output (HDOD) protein